MALTTLQPYEVFEGSTARLTFTISDEDGTAIPASALTTATLSLYNRATNTAINSRNAQNILNANNVTISSAGVVVASLQAADNAIVGTDRKEVHVAVFTFTTGAAVAVVEVLITVVRVDYL